jgi:hypothetical protein
VVMILLLLFSILCFRYRWMHLYIPVVPDSLIRIVVSPCRVAADGEGRSLSYAVLVLQEFALVDAHVLGGRI